VHVKENKSGRVRSINIAIAKEHLAFRAWSVMLGKFERKWMKDLSKDGKIFYRDDPNFDDDFKSVS
jgi:hypothetical protein